MQKNTKKRGRPPIEPSIQNLLTCRVLDEEAKPAEEQRLNKVLAYDIYKELEGKFKRVPKESTLEKKIQQLRLDIRKGYGPEDKPWSLVTLKEYPIPPKALPKVLEVYKNLQSHPEWQEPELTIRDARWIAQLSETEALNRWPFIYQLVSQAERLYESVSKHAQFTFLEDALASMEFGETEYALESREVFESWIRHRLDQMSENRKENPEKEAKNHEEDPREV